MFTELAQNSALLVALFVLYGLLARIRLDNPLSNQILKGILFGGIAIAAMTMAVHHSDGIIYDGRSIVMALSGLFGGTVTAGVSVIIACTYRIFLGGTGVWAGTSTILTTALVGLFFRRFSGNKPESLGIPVLLFFGIIVHLFMLACQLLLPEGLSVIRKIWLPVVLVLPTATFVMGLLLGNEEKQSSTAKALRQSEKNFRRLMDESPMGMHVVSARGEMLYANRAFLSIYGVDTIKEFMNIPSVKRYTPESYRQHLERKERRIKGEPVNPDYDIEIIRPDGQHRYIQIHRKKINWNGTPQFHVISQDLTEKKKAEKQLKLLSRLVEQSPVSIVITDPSGNIEYVNPAFSEVTGYTPEEVIGQNPSILKSGEHSREFYRDLWMTILAGKQWKGEFHNRKKAGELYWESAVISPIFEEDGNITHFVEAKTDITERKTMIADLKAAKEKAEENDRLKSAFLANISHEIRTPLNLILGFTEMLTHPDELTPEITEKYSAIIKKNADDLLGVISDVLDLSKLVTGQMKIVKTKFNIQSFLDELYYRYKKKVEELEKNHIRLTYKNVEVPVDIIADKDRLVQIFTNLLDNSVKFTHEGQIEFGIKTLTENQICFFVRDTGIGIEKNNQSSLFQPFRKINDSLTRSYEGTGMGLSIVKGLIDLMEGEIKLESQSGKGTTVTFMLSVV